MSRYVECAECGDEIYEGDPCYRRRGELLCEGCAKEWLFDEYCDFCKESDCDLDEGRRSDEPDRYNGYEEDE